MMEIEKITYETGNCTRGCDTCDFGSSYITKLSIRTDNSCQIDFEFDTMYDYISESDLMKILSKEYDNEWDLIDMIRFSFDIEKLDINIHFGN